MSGQDPAPAFAPVVLAAEGLRCGYGRERVLEDVSLDLAQGEMVALLGCNGSGKSTLLRCLGGALPAQAGTVRLQGMALAAWDRRRAARVLAVVPQEMRVPFAFSVREVVELGRAPHARFLHTPDGEDREAVEEALEVAGLADLADRLFQRLSGGEQQRVALAMALAQRPQVLLLDEPTVHLDLAHQQQLLATVRRLCAEQGLAVLAAMHDVNLSALYFDRLLVLGDGTLLATGTPHKVLTPEVIACAFGTRVVVTRHPVLDLPQVSLLP